MLKTQEICKALFCNDYKAYIDDWVEFKAFKDMRKAFAPQKEACSHIVINTYKLEFFVDVPQINGDNSYEAKMEAAKRIKALLMQDVTTRLESILFEVQHGTREKAAQRINQVIKELNA